MVRRRIPHFLIALMVLSAWVPASAQSSGKTASPTAVAASAAAEPAAVAVIPKNPTDLMVLASKTNGLAGLNDRPWHMKAMYQTFDADGKPEHLGIFEEWWAGTKQYKVSYSSPDFQQTIYENGTTRLSTGDGGWPPMQAEIVKEYLLQPLPSADFVAQPHYEVQHRKLGQVPLTCMQPGKLPPELAKDAAMQDAPAGVGPVLPTTCFSEGLAAVRVEIQENGLIALFNNIVQIDGHYAAKQIVITDGNTQFVSLNVMTLEFPASIPEAELTPPVTAVTDPPLSVKAGVMVGRRIGGDSVPYPKAAKSQHIEGLVLLSAVIDTKGSIADLRVIAGPKALRDAVVDAVKTWKYQPYLLNGKPVEVQTQINVIFTLGR
jgi:TonB family protein